MLALGVVTVVFAAYVVYIKVNAYSCSDKAVSMGSYIIIAIAAFDFYSDVFFAQRAAVNERSIVAILGAVMIGWLVVVLAVNGWTLVKTKREHDLATNENNGLPFDDYHQVTFTILSLLTFTSTELIAVFPWVEQGPGGFPDEDVAFRAECAGWLEDFPQLALQLTVYSYGGDVTLELVFCTVVSVTAMIVRAVMRRLLPKTRAKPPPPTPPPPFPVDLLSWTD